MPRAKKPPVEDIDEVEDEFEEELEEIDEDDEPAPKAKTKKAPAKAKVEEPTFGVKQLCELIEEETGDEVTTRSMRTLTRKMARDGRLNREIKAGNRERYSWTGPDDPEVKKIVKAYKKGELAAERKAALDKLKASKGKKTKPTEDDEEDDE